MRRHQRPHHVTRLVDPPGRTQHVVSAQQTVTPAGHTALDTLGPRERRVEGGKGGRGTEGGRE